MSDMKMQPVLEITNALRETEGAIANALAKSAMLARQLPQTWADLGISPVVGRAAFDRTGQLVNGMTTAWVQVAEVHNLLDAVRDKLGLPAVSWGDKAGISDDRPVMAA